MADGSIRLESIMVLYDKGEHVDLSLEKMAYREKKNF